MNRILVRTPNWIGDQVMAYPFFKALRTHYPRSWIAVVCPEWVKDIQFKGFVDEVFVVPRRKGDSLFRSFLNIRKFAKHIQQRGPWDLGIAIPNSFGAALMLYLAKVRVRRGYETDARGMLLNDKVNWNPSSSIHRAQAYLNLLENEGALVKDIRDFWEKSSEKKFDPIKHWPEIIPLEPPEEHYFVVAPGATADSRRWSVNQFAELIQQIHQEKGWQAVIVGGNAEKAIANELIRRKLPVIDYCGKGWVSAHWKLFRQSHFTVCNESGLAHVAALCGSSVHIVCGAADPKRTQPLGPGKVQVTINPVDCWPCERNQCLFTDSRKNQCLRGIPAAQVREEIEVGFFSA